MDYRKSTLEVLKSRYQAEIDQHILNMDVMFANPTAIEDHSDFVGTIDKRIESIASLEDKLSVVNSLL